MIANILVRYDKNIIVSEIQWTAGELAEKLNKVLPAPSDTLVDLIIHPIALSHGLSLFQRQLKTMGLGCIIVSTLSKAIPDFFNLTGAQRTIEIKFDTYMNDRPENESFLDQMVRMVKIRNTLLLKNNYEASPHSSPSSVYGNLFYPVLQTFMKRVQTFFHT